MISAQVPGAPWPVMKALWMLAEGRRFASGMAGEGIDVLLLRGPEMQQRLFGDPSAYPCGDVDVLVHRRDIRRLRAILAGRGFAFHASNGLFWRWSGKVKYERAGFAVDVHWGLALAPYPHVSFRRLAADMWHGAARGEGGFLQPRAEALAVFLAAHAASRSFEPPSLAGAARAAAALVEDEREMWRIAARSRLTGILRRVLEGLPQPSPVLARDGAAGTIAPWCWNALRGGWLPAGIADRLHEHVAYWRHGLPLLFPGRRPFAVAGAEPPIQVEVWEGVLGPGTWTAAIAREWIASVAGKAHPAMVDVGTGSGCVAVMGARALPAATVYATDISSRAIRNANANAARLGVPVRCCRGDLLTALPKSLLGRIDGIVAHLPSLPPGGPIDPVEMSVENFMAPRHAYEGPGGDGLDLVRRLLRTAPAWLAPGGRLVLSMQAWQRSALEPEIVALGYRQVTSVAPSPLGVILTLEKAGPE